LSLLRPRLQFDPKFSVYPLEINDSADTDILTHLPSCVAWIQEALDKNHRQLHPDQVMESTSMGRSGSVDKKAQETKAGGVLVHCQAGMSRSATVVAAYLMGTLELTPMEAVEMVKEKRPVVE
jgi:dual specificity phosphatase 12